MKPHMSWPVGRSPVLKPDPAPNSLFITPGRLEWTGISCAIVMLTVCSAFLAIRLYLQRKLGQLFHVSNILLMVALFLVYVSQILNILNDLTGYGQGEYMHRNVEAMKLSGKLTMSYGFISPMSFAFAKTSICIFLIDLFDNRKLHITSYVIIGVTWVAVLLIWTSFSFVCRPDSFNWTNDGQCNPLLQGELFFAYIILDILSEIALFILPFPFIWHMSISMRRWLALVAIFSLGLLCILSDIALIVLNVLPLPHDSDEPLAYGLQVYYYLTPGLPVATASAVCFKPLIDNFLNAWRRYKKARSPDVSSATEEGELETIGRRRQNHNKRGLVGIATTDLNNSDAWLVTRESGEETVVQNSGTTSTTSSKTIGDKDKA